MARLGACPDTNLLPAGRSLGVKFWGIGPNLTNIRIDRRIVIGHYFALDSLDEIG
jgi:hypothetical protein